MKIQVLVMAILLGAGAADAQQPLEEALDGVDPVLLVQGKEVFGTSEFAVERGRFRYLFASAETKATFERDPEKYQIQLNGLCARMGRATSGNPSNFVVHDGRIYIFGSDDCRERFLGAPEKFMEKPAAPFETSPEMTRRGRELLDKAAAAAGGSALDSLTTYVEVVSRVQQRADGPATVSTKSLWQFPDRARLEQTMVMPERTVPFARVLARGAAWTVMPDRVFPASEAAYPSIERDFGRHIVSLLRRRHEQGVEAAALGRGVMGGVDVERVRVRDGHTDVTLGIDPATGRVLASAFIERNADGEVGAYTRLYSDYRDVSGLTLPHAVKTLFDGQPDATLSWTVESVAVNPPLDPALFEAKVETR